MPLSCVFCRSLLAGDPKPGAWTTLKPRLPLDRLLKGAPKNSELRRPASLLALRQTARASSLPTVNRSALKPRSALRKPDFSFDFPPQRGVLTQKTQFDTEVTEASRRGTEHCIGVNAFAGFTRQMNPNSPSPDPEIFLCDLLFVLSGLCDEIGLRILEFGSLSVAADCLAAESRALSGLLSQARQTPGGQECPRSDSSQL